ncbi:MULTISPECIES: hypothetical protein [Ralstonia solanacearum species complex]|uniref:hypothetical protein n=1 Tax=Ralstonia solanacearum species complex TaxID=3116862 RepID=UPI000E59719C|nr:MULTISPECIES: hypothetical protein [Ralstonia solanacearum species complex]AXV75765.1 hypothetical protein CJO76_01500 [Ralstonia solanacearum]AXV89765.1 hypothetical protein CJO79_01500 [Ralstonia solanacearum]AXW17968.1 hypothetical protein CJO85_01520 [Ralstonia solanacearum]AXW74677.1 hypothetical protein CJO97_01500 [Ralstonia solanacearum]BEU70743.1 hypothetical protein MAFF211271_02980 [Ralstonia pseudosolanacearum]
MQKNRVVVDIHAITVREGTSKKNGQPYHMEECACMTTTEYLNPEGVVVSETMPGMVMLPKHLNGKVRPGKFEATVGLGQFEGKLTLRVVDLTPVEAVKAAGAGGGGAQAAKPEKVAA